jgi:YidC/Oxa1 family membrane protein insertase
MNIFQTLFREVVYRPELNLLQFFYNITGDTGFSIIILSVILNLCLWPLLIKAFVNGQKLRILQPKLKEIQTKYKDNQQEIIKQTMAFNKKHGISNGSTFLVIFLQLFFISGLWVLTTDVSSGKQVDGLYSFIFNKDVATFGTKAFGILNIGDPGSANIFLPITYFILSTLYGLYLYKWSPKLEIPESLQEKKKEGEKPVFDPEAFNKTLEFQTIYVMPLFLFFINYGLTTGVNLYSVTAGVLSLLRQIVITYFYRLDVPKLLEEVAQSDPSSVDNIKSNNIDVLADPSQMADAAVPTLMLKKPKSKSSKPAKKGKTAKKKK